jgi:hypothetical protein
MDLADIGKTVAKYAPYLGKVLPIPGGELLGQLVAEAFDGDLKKQDDLISKIEQDPQAEYKLIDMQNKYAIEIAELAIKQLEIENQERDSARQRESDVTKSTGKCDPTPANLAYLLTIGVFVSLYYLFTHSVPVENKEIVNTIIGILVTVWVAAMAYYHGSSAGSRLKDEIFKLHIK